MARYIDADDFYKRLSNPPYTIYNGEMFADWFEECFKTQPTADVEPVRHGKWGIKLSFWGEKYSECSYCGYDISDNDVPKHIMKYDYKYCPNCGAKMD